MKTAYRVLMSLAVVLVLAGLAGAVASGGGTRLEWWEFGTGFTILRWSVYTAIAAVALVLAGTALAVPAGARLLDVRLAPVLLLGLLVAGVPYLHSRQFREAPTVADATTDFNNPPSFRALASVREETAANPLEYRGEEAASLQKKYFPALDALYTDQPPAAVIARAETVAREMGLEVAAVRPDEGRLEATGVTFWFGFRDDLVVRARRTEGGRTRVDARSASRVGYLDGGVNARRIQRFLQALQRRVSNG